MNLIKMVEIYEDPSYGLESRDRHALREVVINPAFVMAIRDNTNLLQKLNNDLLPEGLDPRQEFTKITMNSGQSTFAINVVGDIDTVTKTLLDKKCGRACS